MGKLGVSAFLPALLIAVPGYAADANVFGSTVEVDVDSLTQEGARVVLSSRGVPKYITLRQQETTVARSQEVAAQEAERMFDDFLAEHYEAFGMSSPQDQLTLKVSHVTSPRSLTGLDIPTETIVHLEQEFSGIPVLYGTISLTFLSGELWSVSGEVFPAHILKDEFGKFIADGVAVSKDAARSAAIADARSSLDVGTDVADVASLPELVLDPIGGKLAYVTQVGTWDVFVDSNSGVAYRSNSKRADYAPVYNTAFRALELKNGQRYFLNGEGDDICIDSTALDTAVYYDGAADRHPVWLFGYTWRTTVNDPAMSAPFASDFPFPTTVRVDTGAPEFGLGSSSPFLATAGYSLWAQNAHYRISRAAYSAISDSDLWLFNQYASPHTGTLELSVGYGDSNGGGNYEGLGNWNGRINIGVAPGSDEYRASCNEGRFIPWHEYGHYIHVQYGFWAPINLPTQMGVSEGFADSLAVSLAEYIHDETPTDSTFLAPIGPPTNRMWWLNPHSLSDYHDVVADCATSCSDPSCAEKYDCGLPMAEIVYKFLHNRISDWVWVYPRLVWAPVEIIKSDYGTIYTKEELSKLIIRRALTHAMLNVSRTDPSVFDALVMMHNYIQYIFMYALTSDEKAAVSLAFNQHGFWFP